MPDPSAVSNLGRLAGRHGIGTVGELCCRARDDPEWFWAAAERDLGIVWDEPYSRVLDSSRGIMWSRWFVGGRTNIYRSSVERFARADPGRAAYRFVSEGGRSGTLTYGQLDERACRLAGGLASLGVGRGDVVAVYMPVMEEAVLAVLASAKLGAVCTPIFSGYGRVPLVQRLRDSGASVLIASDGYERRGRPVSQREAVLAASGEVRHVVVARYGGTDHYGVSEGVSYYDELVSGQPASRPTEPVGSEDRLFVLHTSGTTGAPKGAVHVHGGFSVFAAHQAAYLMDMRAGDVLFWPADIGWITGLVWNVYGLLLAGASAVMYDGAPDHPGPDRTWEIASSCGATILGTSPTAARMLRRGGEAPRDRFDLGRLRNIASTGEPLDAGTWAWLFEGVGGRRVPITNLSGGTEVGGAMLSVLPGMALRPSTVGVPVPGMDVAAVDDAGREVARGEGHLVVRAPWPAMSRGLLGDDGRFLEAYWSRFEGVWFHGDRVSIDDAGLWYMGGRSDDVVNVSGHRMGTAEIEQAAMSHPSVSDAAAVPVPDPVTGQALVLFYVVSAGTVPPGAVLEYVAGRLGRAMRPRTAVPMSDLPRTRTGKVLRRVLGALLLGGDPGDLSSVDNPLVLGEVPRIC